MQNEISDFIVYRIGVMVITNYYSCNKTCLYLDLPVFAVSCSSHGSLLFPAILHLVLASTPSVILSDESKLTIQK